MSNGALLSIFFCVLVAQSISFSSQSLGHHSSFLQTSKSLQPSLHRIARQDDQEMCFLIFLEASTKEQCSPSFAQSVIDMVSQCGQVGGDAAIEFENDCRKNSAGKLCGAIDVRNVEIICQSSSSTGCSPECRESLNKVVTDNGCCMYHLGSLQDLFPLCVVDIPSPCPPTSLNIPPTSSSKLSCQADDDFDKFYREIVCSLASPIMDSLNSNNCPGFAKSVEIECIEQDGEFCVEKLKENSTMDELNEAYFNCYFTPGCSTSCKMSLNNLTDILGCCLNIYNPSYVMGTQYFDPNIAFAITGDNDLWQECGITPPGICASASPLHTTVGSIAFFILSVPLFFLYNNYFLIA